MAVGLASLDGALSPPEDEEVVEAAAASFSFSFLALSSAYFALVSASLAACLSIIVVLGLVGEAALPSLVCEGGTPRF